MYAQDTKVTRLLRWAAGEKPGPWEITVFPTNRCNLRCKICWQRWIEAERGKVDTTSEVSDERLLRLVDEAADLGVREWSIVGGGDPMIRADLVMNMCERIVRRGMAGEVYTNGTLFKPHHLEHLVNIGWWRVSISLDGHNAEINDAVRWEGSFERATNNIRLLNELRRRRGTKLPELLLHTVVTNRNWNRLTEMVQLGYELESTSMGLSFLVPYDANIGNQFALSPEQAREFPAHLQEAIDLAQRLNIPNNFRTLLPAEEQRERSLFEGDGSAGMERMPLYHAECFEPWLSLAIIAEGGRVGPCCIYFDQDGARLGEAPLKETWEGEYLERVREATRTRTNMHPCCRGCTSCFKVRTADLRNALRAQSIWRYMTPAERVRFLGARLARNLRERGLRQTIRRAKEWIQLHRA